MKNDLQPRGRESGHGLKDPMRTAGRADLERVPASVWGMAVLLAAGSVMAGLDTSLVNVGLNTIGSTLGASLPAVQWVNSGYLLALAAALPACGWLSRKLGASRLWLWALAGFTLASVLC